MKKLILLSLLIVGFGSNAQETLVSKIKYVKGIVKDTEGKAMLGLTVKILGTDKYAITDFDGIFCMAVPENTEIFLSISCFYNPIVVKLNKEEREVKISINSTRRIKRSSKQALKEFSKNEVVIKTKLKSFYKLNDHLPMRFQCD